MRKAIFLALALVLCTAGGAFAAEEAAKAEAPKVVYGTAVGSVVKPVQLKSVDGSSTVDTGALKKTSVFMLVSSVCTSCSAELQEVSANLDAFKDRDVYAVVIDMDPSRASGSMAKFKLPLLADSDWAFGQAVGLASAPSVVIIGTDGKITYKTYGYRRDQWKDYTK